MLKVTRCEFVHNLPCEQVGARIAELEEENERLRNLCMGMRIAIVAVAVAVVIVLCGCGNGIARDEDNDAGKLSVDGRFITDSASDRFSTVVDSHTGVTYLVWDDQSGNASVGGITVLLNRDGTPVLSEEVHE